MLSKWPPQQWEAQVALADVKLAEHMQSLVTRGQRTRYLWPLLPNKSSSILTTSYPEYWREGRMWIWISGKSWVQTLTYSLSLYWIVTLNIIMLSLHWIFILLSLFCCILKSLSHQGVGRIKCHNLECASHIRCLRKQPRPSWTSKVDWVSLLAY